MSIKEDGSEFDNDDLQDLMKEMHPLASKLAEETDISHYQPVYDAENKRLPAPTHDVEDLIPPIRKHTLAPQVDPAGLIDDEAEFEALNNIDWSSSTFQEREQGEDAERANPDASGQS